MSSSASRCAGQSTSLYSPLYPYSPTAHYADRLISTAPMGPNDAPVAVRQPARISTKYDCVFRRHVEDSTISCSWPTTGMVRSRLFFVRLRISLRSQSVRDAVCMGKASHRDAFQ